MLWQENDMDDQVIKYQTINQNGLIEIAEFLGRRFKKAVISGEGAGYFDDSMLAAWAAEAEFQLAEGNPPSIEISGFDSVSGNPETFEVSPEGVDTNYVDGFGNDIPSVTTPDN